MKLPVPDFRSSLRRRTKRRRGATLVEFALLVPVIFTILFGIMEFAWMARNNLMLANSTREGARTASLGKSTTDIRARVVNSAKPLVITNSQVLLTYSIDNGATYPFTLSDSNGWWRLA